MLLLKAEWIPRGVLLTGLIVRPTTPTHSDSRETSLSVAWDLASHLWTEPTVKLGMCHIDRGYSVQLARHRGVAAGPTT